MEFCEFHLPNENKSNKKEEKYPSIERERKRDDE